MGGEYGSSLMSDLTSARHKRGAEHLTHISVSLTSVSCRDCSLPLLKMRKLRLKPLKSPEGPGETLGAGISTLVYGCVGFDEARR